MQSVRKKGNLMILIVSKLYDENFNNASLSFGRTSTGTLWCFFGLCATICGFSVCMCVFTRLSLLLTDVWADLSYLFFLGEVKVYTFFGEKANK